MKKLSGYALPVLMLTLMLQACVSTGGRSEDPEQAADIYADLGLQYLQQGNAELARIKLERSLELNPKHKNAHLYIAETYKQLGENESAEQHYGYAVKYDGDNPTVLNNYGAFLCDAGRFSKAEEYFVRAANSPRYRTPELAYENLALCAIRAKEEETAEQYFRKALEIKPALPKSLYQLALIQYNKQDYLRARAFIERLHSFGYTEPSLKLAIKVEDALNSATTAEEYRRLLKEKFPGTGR